MRLTATCMAALAAVGAGAGAELRLSGPYTHENLSIYLVHGQDRFNKKYLTLGEAIAQRKVVVYETSNVNELQVENLSADDVYIQSGEIVKGGKQDRVLTDDIILPTASGKVKVKAFCVEHGRWTQRGRESAQAFAASPSAIASPAMKRAVKEAGRQGEVWAEVEAAQTRLARSLGTEVRSAVSESSYQLTVESRPVQQSAEGFKKALAGVAGRHGDALGYVMAVNGQVTGSDVYATHDLFVKMWPKLLDAAAVEAIGAGRPNGPAAAPALADVRAAATGYGAVVSEDQPLNARTNKVKAELRKGLVYETRDTSAPAGAVHRTYVAK